MDIKNTTKMIIFPKNDFLLISDDKGFLTLYNNKLNKIENQINFNINDQKVQINDIFMKI